MTTSHSDALRVLRMNPRRWAHHVYFTLAPMSRATSSAILFSNPSPFELLKGRLLGSAHTRRSGARAPADAIEPSDRTPTTAQRADPVIVMAGRRCRAYRPCSYAAEDPSSPRQIRVRQWS